jgi:hypothetical protein
VNNKLRLFVYGKVIAGHIDPIEKKPVTHYRIRYYILVGSGYYL